MAGMVSIARFRVSEVTLHKVGTEVFTTVAQAEQASISRLQGDIIRRVKLAFKDIRYDVAQDSVCAFNEALLFIQDNTPRKEEK